MVVQPPTATLSNRNRTGKYGFYYMELRKYGGGKLEESRKSAGNYTTCFGRIKACSGKSSSFIHFSVWKRVKRRIVERHPYTTSRLTDDQLSTVHRKVPLIIITLFFNYPLACYITTISRYICLHFHVSRASLVVAKGPLKTSPASTQSRVQWEMSSSTRMWAEPGATTFPI